MRRGALVLCGGRSTRMGRDKATLPFGREVLLQRVVRLVAQAVADIVVVARRDQALPVLPDDVRVVHDEVEDQGPMGGLLPGLAASRADAVYATGCDVPFLRPQVVDLLFARLEDHDVAVADADGHLHPLAAVYRVAVRRRLGDLFTEGRRRPRDLYERVDTVRIGEGELRVIDPELATLANLNTPEAYEAALRRLEGEDAP